MQTIRIEQGYENSTYISELYEIIGNVSSDVDRKNYFYSQYMQAAKCIDSIVMGLDKFVRINKDEELDYNTESYEQNKNIMGYPNNILAFCSSRGNGKTSAMLTMIHALTQAEPDEHKKKVIDGFWDRAHEMVLALPRSERKNIESPVRFKKFRALGVIDPTTMEEHDSILEIIISRLLKLVKDRYAEQMDRRNDYRDGGEQYRYLLKLFSQTQKKIRSLKEEKETNEFDEFERITETDDSRSTKYAFYKLVREATKYLGVDMIIVPVDDSDMDPGRTYDVTEDLRKYCDIPRILIIMSLHLGTLKSSIEQHYIGLYKYLLQTGYKIEHMSQFSCRELAERYVDKLIPGMHQIWLPYINQRIQDGRDLNLEYYVKSENGREIDLLPLVTNKHNGEGIIHEKAYLDRVTMLLYQKTGVVFLNKRGYLHDFLPKRLRELTHFLSFFTRLKDIGIDDEYTLENLIEYKYFSPDPESEEEKRRAESYEDMLECRVRNMEQLENYFFSLWCPLNLTKNMCEKLNDLRVTGITSKNKRVMDILREYCRDNEVTSLDMEFDFGSGEVCFADVLTMLKKVKAAVNDKYKFDFLHAIQIYYTILMNKIMCMSLKKGKDFGNIRSLTQGVITRMPDKETIFEEDNSNTDANSENIYYYHCDEKGYINDDSTGSKYVRIEPYGFLFDVLHSFDKEVMNSSKSGGHIERLYGLGDDLKKQYVRRVSYALKYICNYDLQYYAYHNNRDYIKKAIRENSGICVSQIQDMMFSIMDGKDKDGKIVHYLDLCDKKDGPSGNQAKYDIKVERLTLKRARRVTLTDNLGLTLMNLKSDLAKHGLITENLVIGFMPSTSSTIIKNSSEDEPTSRNPVDPREDE